MKIKQNRIKFEEKDIKRILFRMSAHMDIWTPQHKDELDEVERILGDDDIKEITGLFYKDYKRKIKNKNLGKKEFKKKFFPHLESCWMQEKKNCD